MYIPQLKHAGTWPWPNPSALCKLFETKHTLTKPHNVPDLHQKHWALFHGGQNAGAVFSSSSFSLRERELLTLVCSLISGSGDWT